MDQPTSIPLMGFNPKTSEITSASSHREIYIITINKSS